MIGFNKPYITGKELVYISDAHSRGQLSGDGYYTSKCHDWLKIQTGTHKALLTHSCTAALEMAAILAGIQPGDEVIMPSYTFVSTANAFVLRGGVPVFIDIRPDTLNINEYLIEAAITARTKAIVCVHYAGVSCEMNTVMEVAKRNSLVVIEDAAQGVMSTYQGRALGSIGHLGCFSFHETKNIISGEGGALLINDPILAERAEIIWEKGTNRKQFFRGQVDKYTWVDIGSSYLPGELTAAFLLAQLENANDITNRRQTIWSAYDSYFKNSKFKGRIALPVAPKGNNHNAHIYYLLLNNLADRTQFIAEMKNLGVNCVFHYVPLHSSEAGLKYGRAHGSLGVTVDIADRLVRLPLWVGLEGSIEEVLTATDKALMI